MKKLLTNKTAILVIPGFIIGLLLNWIVFLGRTQYAGNYLIAFNSIFDNPALIVKALPISFHRADLIVFAGAMIGTILLQLNLRKSRKKYKPGEEHGSARWGNKEDIEPFVDPVFAQNIILSKSEYLTMNSRPAKWETARNKNGCIVGGSGSGKTRNFIKPNIMQMHSSYVVTDPKGTILNEVGYMLEKNGYKIKVLDLIDMKQSMKYNPFAYVHEAEDILKLIETIMANTSGEASNGEDFWVKAERLLYQALMAAVFFEFPEHEKNLGSIIDLLGMMKTSEEDESFMNAIDLWFEDLEKKHDDIMASPNMNPKEKEYASNLGYAVNQYKSYKLAAGKTAKSILISCAARLSAVNIPKVKNLLSADELELENLGKEKTALFIIIPDTDRTYNFIASILYTQLFNRLCTIADKEYGGRLPIHVRCLLDEFANVGKIPNWEILITTIRSREISATMVLQTKSQLKAMYKDHAETIIGNCDYEIFLGGKEKGTLKEIAESLGKQTINDMNTSDTRGTSGSKSVSYSKLGRELMSYDELTVMNRKKCVVQLSGVPPFFSEKYDITTHPMYPLHASGNKDKKWFVVTEYIERMKKRQQTAPVTMKTLIKRCPVVKKIKTTSAPLTLVSEGDEVYFDIIGESDGSGGAL